MHSSPMPNDMFSNSNDDSVSEPSITDSHRTDDVRHPPSTTGADLQRPSPTPVHDPQPQGNAEMVLPSRVQLPWLCFVELGRPDPQVLDPTCTIDEEMAAAARSWSKRRETFEYVLPTICRR